MRINPIAQKALLALVLAATVMASAATAQDGKEGKEGKEFTSRPAAMGRDSDVLLEEVRSGKAEKLHIPGREVNITAVWDGCTFHYLKSSVESYLASQGEFVEVVSDPEPLPPKDKNCGPDRNPNAEEVRESRARANAANAGARLPGAPPNPPEPPIPGIPGT